MGVNISTLSSNEVITSKRSDNFSNFERSDNYYINYGKK